jgi:phosphopentomutase
MRRQPTQMPAINRIILIILDSVGIGALPDAADYGDVGSNTLGNLARARGGLNLPHLGRLGLGNLTEVTGVPAVGSQAAGAFGRAALASPGKDTMTGHWELAGIQLDQPIQVFPDGFPEEVIQMFEERTGRRVLGNMAASGTGIIADLGEEHMVTGSPIVYTSADSVFQIAAHEEVIPLDELYRMCEIAREIMQGPYLVGRIIARPFLGQPGTFKRTENRKDYTIKPPAKMLLDYIKNAGLDVLAVGKIEDIYAGQGITKAKHTKDNLDGLKVIKEFMSERRRGLVMANLVDFDMLYGHRNDVEGYARALEVVDAHVPELLDALEPSDVLVFVADHGCDPTTPSTDHSREYVPLLLVGDKIRPGVDVGARSSLADLGATVADLLGVPYEGAGQSFARMIMA